jgi:hypothetical protein
VKVNNDISEFVGLKTYVRHSEKRVCPKSVLIFGKSIYAEAVEKRLLVKECSKIAG